MNEIHLTLKATIEGGGRYVVRDDTGKVVFTCPPGQSYIVPAASAPTGAFDIERVGDMCRQAAAEGIRVGKAGTDGDSTDYGIAYNVLNGIPMDGEG